MGRYKKVFGIAGITGAAVCAAALAVSAILQGFSPLHNFIAQLGAYPGRAIVASPALLMNAGLMLFGLTFGAYMFFCGWDEATPARIVLGIFGVLAGLLAVATAMYTMNNAAVHFIASGAFYAAVFVLSVLYIVFAVLRFIKLQMATLIVALLTGLSSAAFALFVLTGNMAQTLAMQSVDAAQSVEPFALVGLGALVLTLAFAIMLAAEVLGGENTPAAATTQKRKVREIAF